MSDTLQVQKDSGIFVPNVAKVRVRQQQGFVYLIAGSKTLEMRTPVAHRIGFALVKQAGEIFPGEHIQLVINGSALNFDEKGAKQVGAALLRKADCADDFQQRIHK